MEEIKQTERASDMLNRALKCCRNYRHEFIMPEHLLLVLMESFSFNSSVTIFYSPYQFEKRIKDFLEGVERVPDDVDYDPEVLPLRKLLKLYFLCIEPTSVNQQGEDCGTRYRTGIYYVDPADYGTIADVMREEQSGYSAPIAVEVEPLKVFHPADESHQDYLDKHPDGYCHLPQGLFELARHAN